MEQVIFLLAMGFASFVQTVAGFAGNLLAMPVGIMTMGVDTARIVVNIVSCLSCVFIVTRDYKAIVWRELVTILATMGIGLALGALVISYFWNDSFLLYYGFFVIFVGLKHLFFHKEVTLPHHTGIAILIGAGFIHSLYLSGGTLLVMYMLGKFPEKTKFRVHLAAIWVVLDCVIVAMQFLQGQLTAHVLQLTAVATIPALFGVYLGYKTQERMQGPLFFKAVNFMLLISGALLVVTG